MTIEVDVTSSPAEAARTAASRLIDTATTAIARSGRFVWAVSGGSTPARFLAELARRDELDWQAVHLFQVDERLAPPGSPERNDTMIRAGLVDRRPEVNYHPIPVDAADLGTALAEHQDQLTDLTGSPACLDLVQLGLGTDGHTASLVPDDPALAASTDLAVTGYYRGTRRVTMTAPFIGRAATRLFLVTGADKAAAVAQLVGRDPTIPATLVTPGPTTAVIDRAAAVLISPR